MHGTTPRDQREQEGCEMNGRTEKHEPDEQEIDACDRPVPEAEATPDEDLPAAEGGVA